MVPSMSSRLIGTRGSPSAGCVKRANPGHTSYSGPPRASSTHSIGLRTGSVTRGATVDRTAACSSRICSAATSAG